VTNQRVQTELILFLDLTQQLAEAAEQMETLRLEIMVALVVEADMAEQEALLHLDKDLTEDFLK
jgi:hypothetical protein